jgi:uncharacterized protein YoxC
MNTETLLTIFVGLTGLALLVQAIVAVAALVTARKTIKTMQTQVEELRSVAMPILKRSHEVIDRVSPKVESIAGNLEELSHNARKQGADIQATTNDILARVHRQSSRVDAILTNVIDSMEHAGNVVADSVSKPARQASAMLASVKAFLSVLATGRRRERPAEVAADQDMFV